MAVTYYSVLYNYFKYPQNKRPILILKNKQKNKSKLNSKQFAAHHG